MKVMDSLVLPVVLAASSTLFVGCAPEPPQPAEVLKSVAKVAESAGVELPLEPAQVTQITQSLQELTTFVDEAQLSKTRFEGASNQGRARMIQRNLSQFLDGLKQPLPFRSNLERIVEILSESSDGELSENDREAIRAEIQAIRDELGLSDSATDNFSGNLPPAVPGPPGPPGPAGPGPGGPGPPLPPGR